MATNRIFRHCRKYF